ncbi:hypothetical protein [Anaeromyxobacter oryzisoli]|jgi:hypothetical protein|uniref:hypothetical protein n=1 Tax=Anaeromyxobacter oryzisoli TaxID=2925408 RepID=UPI001F56467F|nr:hypothetical protein [Anaeromyxobacter sp. SG63]
MNAIAMTGAAAALTGLLLAGNGDKAPPDPRDYGPDRIDISSYPDEQRKEYVVYSAKCVKCHPLARSVNAHYDARDWKRYLKRMIRRPNSGINEEQAAQIYDFLKFHADKMGY